MIENIGFEIYLLMNLFLIKLKFFVTYTLNYLAWEEVFNLIWVHSLLPDFLVEPFEK
jgi:hypothetical protein